MPGPACAGTSTWEYQNGAWVCIQSNCNGSCGRGTCQAVMTSRSDPMAQTPEILAILDNPQEGQTVQGSCGCQ